MELKHNKIDVLVYVISFVLVVCLLVVSNVVAGKNEGKVRYAIITVEGEQKYKLDMSENKEIVFNFYNHFSK